MGALRTYFTLIIVMTILGMPLMILDLSSLIVLTLWGESDMKSAQHGAPHR
jgi:hypothetical protein